jgi:hypothetical protein
MDGAFNIVQCAFCIVRVLTRDPAADGDIKGLYVADTQ